MLTSFSKLKKCQILDKFKYNIGYVEDIYFLHKKLQTAYLSIKLIDQAYADKLFLISSQNFSSEPFLNNKIYLDISEQEIKQSPYIKDKMQINLLHELKIIHYYNLELPSWLKTETTTCDYHTSYLTSLNQLINNKYEVYLFKQYKGYIQDLIINSKNCRIYFLETKYKNTSTYKIFLHNTLCLDLDHQNKKITITFAEKTFTSHYSALIEQYKLQSDQK